MIESKIISDSELNKYQVANSEVKKTEALFKQQIDTWALAKKNYQDLGAVKKKEFDFDIFKIILQFNPGRITSSSAKVDAKSINERPCFLCTKNLPDEQKGILCNDKYLILVNPFPIFEEHFTIPQIEHNPQEIYPNFSDILTIAKKLGEGYTLFYNGPKCGASAPDHMHFQASPKNKIPVEYEINTLLKTSEAIVKNSTVSVYAITNYLRNFILIESNNSDSIIQEFNKLYASIQELSGNSSEPMMNVIVSYDDNWRVFIIPRKAHRPKEFFGEGDEKILLSPAAVDFGGLFITPREEDFNKITKEDIVNIFQQTSMDDLTFHKIIKSLNS
jgi:ATP adenylyltransferase/5',5'''-P-1,P-4-tetraphosphate phosphorylase II